MVPEIFGVNAPLRAVADLFAANGFAVLMPDMFWRLERDVELDYDKASYQRAFALHKAFDYGLGVQDLNSAIAALKALPECTGRIGVTGFCLGGTFAYLAAARCPIEAAAGYYGTRIQNFLGDAARVSKPLLQHFGETDHTTPPEILGPILDACKGNPNITSYVYKGAGHAFANPGRSDTYVESAAALAHRRTFELFRRALA
jgi:carboxymethylenebutenolidase